VSTEAKPTRSRTDLVGVGFILLSTLQFGSVVVLGRIATRPGGLPVPSLLAYRFGAAALLMAGALVVARVPLAAAPGERWPLVGLGMIGYAAEAGLFFAGLRHGTAAAVTLLFFTYPVLVSVIAFLTGKGLPGWLLGGGLVSAVSGAAIVAVAGEGIDVSAMGALLALGAALTFSFYLIGADAVLRRTNSLTGAMWVSASAAVGLAVFALATGNASWPSGLRQWGPILGMATLSAGAFACLFAGLRRLGAVRTSVLSAAEPLTAGGLAGLFLGESIGWATLLGGVFILAGAIAASVARPRPYAEPPIA
jgi:drug/metabolite transporter (DMT)-like permease